MESDDFMTPGFWGPMQDDFVTQLSGGNITGPLSRGGRPQGSRNGINKNDNGHSGHYAALTNQENTYLTDMFYRQLKAAGGIHYLYNHMRMDGKTIPWRKVVAFHKAQVVNQKSRPAKPIVKSLAVVPKKDDLNAVYHIGIDNVVMQQGTGPMKDRGYMGIMNIVDYATRMSFPMVIRNETGPHLGQKIEQWVKDVRQDLYGNANAQAWPGTTMIVTLDNGGGFQSADFRDALTDELGNGVAVTFNEIQPNIPNQNAITENSNKQMRNILRRISQANRATFSGNPNKIWQSNWYGANGRIFKQMRTLINRRIDESLGKKQPIDVWNAYKARLNGNATPAQNTTIDESQDALVEDARGRRGASTLKEDKFFKPGQLVRRVKDDYVKADLRSNLMKQSGRWTDELYQIEKVYKQALAPPQYKLSLVPGTGPASTTFEVDNNYNPPRSIKKFSHDRLQLVIAQEQAPQNLMEGQPPAPPQLQVGDRLSIGWLTIKVLRGPANNPGNAYTYEQVPAFNIYKRPNQGFQDPGMAANQFLPIERPLDWDGVQFFDADVTQVNQGGNRRIYVNFPADNTNIEFTIHNPTWANYIAPEYWDKI